MKDRKLKPIANAVGVAPLGDPHFGENTLESSKACSNPNSKHQTLTSNVAITLIALVITIIVMLILVGVTVNIAINGGLFSTAKQAVTDTQYHADREMLLSAVIGAIGSNAEVDFTELDKNLPNGFTKAEDGGYMSKAGNTFYVDKNGNITDEPPKTAAQLFDVASEKIETVKSKQDTDYFTTDGKLHIGDFINYTAGDWKAEEISAIRTGEIDSLQTANGKNDKLPTQSYQFGGFAAGDSRDGNAKPCSDTYKYAKFSDDKDISGWRLFDVDEEEGTITLISAGCPEDYYHDEMYHCGYISEYILSGNINDGSSGLDLENSYTKRRWNNYVNTAQHAESANAITKRDLDDWYKKYMEVGDNFDSYLNNKFQNVYETRYENLIDNYSEYWLATGTGGACYDVFDVIPSSRQVYSYCDGALGIRVLVTLSSDVQLSKSGEKTVKNIEDDENRSEKPYTYNVWDIQ